MASNFALSLAPDGLRLLHRVEGGWALVGEVHGGTADLAAALASLRRQAERIDPGGLRTKLLIPNDQIRYIALDGAQPTAEAVRAALEGATPYEVDDLVWDTARGGGRTYVAAVARETLEEAETFAVAHGFAPVSFAAVPAPFTFRGEAYFGPTSVAGADADSRDARPVAIVADARSVDAVPDRGPDAHPAEAAAASPEVQPEAPEAPLIAAENRHEEPAEVAPPASAAAERDAAASPPPRLPLAAEARTAEATVSFASRARVVRELERNPPPLARNVAADAPNGTASFFSRREEPVLRSVAGPRPGPQAGRSETAPRVGGAERPTAAIPRAVPVPAPASEPTQAVQPLERSPAPLVQGTASRRDSTSDAITPAAAAATLQPLAAEPEPARRGPVGRSAEAESDAAALALERERMAAFAKRGDRKVRGKPRFLGLILTALLLLVMAAVAAWAIGEERLSAWLGVIESPSETEVAAAPEPEPSPALAEVSELLPPAPVVAPEVAEAVPAEPEPEPEPDLAGTVVAPADAERFYAATGVWIRGARLPLRPRSDSFDLPLSVVTRPAKLPEEPVTEKLAMLLPDVGLGKQPVPPPAGSVFARDERGFILATPEGTVTPAGVLAISGEPDFVPPTRPGTELPAIPPEIDLAPPEVAAAPAPAGPPSVAGDGGVPGLAVPDRAALAETADADAVPVIVTTPTLPIPPELPPEAIAVSDAPPPAVPPTRPGTALSAVGSAPVTVAEIATTGAVGGRPPVQSPARPSESAIAAPSEEAPDLTGQEVRLVDGLPQSVPPARAVAATAPEPRASAVSVGAPPVVPPARTEFASQPLSPARAGPSSDDPPASVLPSEAAAPADPAAATQFASIEGGAPPAPTPASAATGSGDPAATERASADGTAESGPDGEAAPVKSSDIVLVSAKPPAVPPGRPAARTLAAAPGGAEVPGLAPTTERPALPPLASFDGPRPVPRQAAAAPQDQRALPPFDGPRPALRQAAAPTPTPEPEPAPPPVDVTATLAAIVAGAGDPLAGATRSAVPRSMRPDSRPRNFATVVSRARERVAPTTVPRTQGGVPRQEEEADNEPEVASAAAARPTGPTPGGVAGAATEQNAINLREVNLIGVYGRPSDRRALIRLANGRYLRVSIGDRLEGGQVTAIGDDALNYVVRGRTYLLRVPEG